MGNSWHNKSIKLPQLCEEISNPNLDYKKDREKINELILNLTLKYIAEYFGIPQDASIDNIGNKVAEENVRAMSGDTLKEELMGMVNGMMGMMGQIDQNSLKSNDVGAKQSLGDLHQTAAIVKEIIFAPEKFQHTDTYLTVDLGSGSGILLLAGMIAGTRNKVQQVFGYGIDSSTPATKKSQQIFQKNFPTSSHRWKIENANILNPNVHIPYAGKVDYMLSETITQNTPSIMIQDDGQLIPNKYSSTNPYEELEKMYSQMHNEPYFLGLIMASEFDRTFIQKVRNGVIQLFPNVINENYIPMGEHGLIKLKTGLTPNSHIHLNNIGKEFDQISSGLPQVHQTRW